MNKAFLIITAAIAMLFSACTGGIKADMLYGKWNYVKVGVPNSSPPDTVTHAELDENKPFINFSKNGQFNIIWGGNILSHGTYDISGNNIKVKEALDGGKTRDFQFYVSELTAKSITFETTGQGGSRVTALK